MVSAADAGRLLQRRSDLLDVCERVNRKEMKLVQIVLLQFPLAWQQVHEQLLFKPEQMNVENARFSVLSIDELIRLFALLRKAPSFIRTLFRPAANQVFLEDQVLFRVQGMQ